MTNSMKKQNQDPQYTIGIKLDKSHETFSLSVPSSLERKNLLALKNSEVDVYISQINEENKKNSIYKSSHWEAPKTID